MGRGPRIGRAKDGGVRIRLAAQEQELLAGLPARLRTLLDEDPDDPALRRLYPPAYVEDPEQEAEYRRLMGDDLRDRRLSALALLEETVGATHLTEEQANGWLVALNELRLVLGTRLGVSEDDAEAHEEALDPEDPRTAALAVYHYLSWLQSEMVDALNP